MAVSIAALVFGAALLVVLVVLVTAGVVLAGYRRKALDGGYASLGDYLRAAPRDDGEKKEAVDLLLKGIVVCLLGLIFPPLLLLGVFPLFFGLRKVAYAQMGFGLSEETDPPRA